MLERISAFVAALILIFVVGTIGYRELAATDVNVIVQLKKGEDPALALKQIMPADASLREVLELDRGNNEYMLTVKTHRKRQGLLDWLRSSSRVQKAEIKLDN